MRTSLYDYCAAHNPDLLSQWVTEQNEPLTPQTVSYGSKKKIWWQCGKGHQWQSAVYTRTGASGQGCPYCAGKRPCPGDNDLASQRPEIAAQWHPTKNSTAPDMVTVGSHHIAWCVCEKGHEWRAMVKTRSEGAGCPVCANRVLAPGVNDLASNYPDLAAQWHPTKNGSLKPESVIGTTSRKVWWICEKGHAWQATAASRIAGSGCPVCAGKKVLPGVNDFASHYPELASQWHPKKNGTLQPNQVTPFSNLRVWWRCPLGHDYLATVSHRTRCGSGCPYCAGRKVLKSFNDLATIEPEVAAQWHPTLNGTFTPEQVTPGSRRKVWWQCPDRHVWKAEISARAGTQKTGCPVCAGRVNPKRQRRYAAVMNEQVQTTSNTIFENEI